MLNAKHKKAQSTLEYIVVLTAIVGLIIYAAVNWVGPAVQKGLTDAKDTVVGSSQKVSNLP
jgi:hypothetical protein